MDTPVITIPTPETGPSHRLSLTDPATMVALTADVGALVNVFANTSHDWQTTALKAVGVIVAGVWSMVTVNAKHRMTVGLAGIAARLSPLVPETVAAIAPVLKDPAIQDALTTADEALRQAHNAISAAKIQTS